MSQWFMWLAFDVIADLSFGKELGTVEMGEENDWVHMLANSGFQIALGYVVRRRWQGFQNLVRYCLVNKKSKMMREKYLANARHAASQRIRRGANVERFDFFSHLLSEKTPEANIDFFASQGSTLVAAGTETTSTFMSALTYHLLQQPHCLKRLQEELRYTFQQHSEIDATHVTSRDERWFYKAKEFHPERWLSVDHPYHDSTFNNDQKEASKPFSIGPRSCIGIHLSYMEVRICIAKLVWSFDWEQVHEKEDFVTDARLLGLWKASPFHVRFRPFEGLAI
ncbi:cytochrome p450 monooxygenase [Colletotrichum tofieldiae]|nr:cytochrome p450 monooxygenase [Colletotrichum tofieldiae]